MISALRIHNVTEIRVKRTLLREGAPDAFRIVEVVFITDDGEMSVSAFTDTDEVPIQDDLTEGATA